MNLLKCYVAALNYHPADLPPLRKQFIRPSKGMGFCFAKHVQAMTSCSLSFSDTMHCRNVVVSHLRTHQCHASGSLWKPLVPAHCDSYLAILGAEHLEACVTWVEVKLLLVPATSHEMWLVALQKEMHRMVLLTQVFLYAYSWEELAVICRTVHHVALPLCCKGKKSCCCDILLCFC